jgi:cell wall-associated NlpC family hydrolase
MASRGTVSGTAVGIMAAGGLLLWTGITNRGIADGLRDILQGRPPGTSGTPTGPALQDITTDIDRRVRAAAGADTGAGAGAPASGPQLEQFVATARAQLGKPYVWAAAGPNAFDCSGLVTFCLKAAGLDDQRRVTAQYLVWTGAFNIARSQCAVGDLVCWTGHIGIAVSNSRMIHAPSAGRPVQEGNIWSQPPPVIRRIRATRRKTGA